jgi:hypothetical protein
MGLFKNGGVPVIPKPIKPNAVYMGLNLKSDRDIHKIAFIFPLK